MLKRTLLSLLLVGLALPAAAGSATGQAPPEVTTVAVTYANALASGNTAAAWQLLSEKSRKETDSAQWQRAFETRPTVPKPPATTLLRALATADPPPTVGDSLLRSGQAFVEVSGSVEVTQDLVLVREKSDWKVDLAATDRLNSQRAAKDFLDAVAQEAVPGRSARMPEASLSLLRIIFASEAKDYKVAKAQVTGDRAEVTVGAQIPVNLVLRAARSGPGWAVDISRPVLPIDTTAPKPLEEAAAVADKDACEEQLRQLVRAIQLYAASSDDILPKPDHWLDQIRQYLPADASLHCPRDTTAGVSYAYNANLAGKRAREVANAGLVPMFYESRLHTRNPADTGQSWAEPRHKEGSLVAFADGSIRPVLTPPSFAVSLAPPGAPRVSLPRPQPPPGQPRQLPQRRAP